MAAQTKNPILHKKEPWAFVAVSKDYNKDKGTFKYIVGDVVTKVDSIPIGLQYYEIPALTYARTHNTAYKPIPG